MKKGFTLIELLVVIAIIGILSSIVLASLDSARRKSRDVARVAGTKQLQNALELYYTTNGHYPGGDETGADFQGLAPVYISSIPVGPQNDVYQYQGLTDPGTGGACAVGGNCQFYHLGILLEAGPNSGGLLVDKDKENVAGPTNGTTIDGISTQSGCGADAIATTLTDLCYDVTP